MNETNRLEITVQSQQPSAVPVSPHHSALPAASTELGRAGCSTTFLDHSAPSRKLPWNYTGLIDWTALTGSPVTQLSVKHRSQVVVKSYLRLVVVAVLSYSQPQRTWLVSTYNWTLDTVISLWKGGDPTNNLQNNL